MAFIITSIILIIAVAVAVGYYHLYVQQLEELQTANKCERINFVYSALCHSFASVVILFSVLAAKDTKLKEMRRVGDLKKESQNKKVKDVEEELQTANKCEKITFILYLSQFCSCGNSLPLQY